MRVWRSRDAGDMCSVLFCSKLLCCFLGSYEGLVFSKVLKF